MPFMPGKQPNWKQLINLYKKLESNPNRIFGRVIRKDKPRVRVVKMGKSTVIIKSQRSNHFPILQLKALNRYYNGLSRKKGCKYVLRRLKQYFATKTHYVYEYIGATDAEILGDYLSGRMKEDVLFKRALQTFEKQRPDLFKGLSKLEKTTVDRFGKMVGEAIEELMEHAREVAFEMKFERNPDLSRNNFLVIGMEPDSNRIILSVKDQPWPSVLGRDKDSGMHPTI